MAAGCIYTVESSREKCLGSEMFCGFPYCQKHHNHRVAKSLTFDMVSMVIVRSKMFAAATVTALAQIGKEQDGEEMVGERERAFSLLPCDETNAEMAMMMANREGLTLVREPNRSLVLYNGVKPWDVDGWMGTLYEAFANSTEKGEGGETLQVRYCLGKFTCPEAASLFVARFKRVEASEPYTKMQVSSVGGRAMRLQRV